MRLAWALVAVLVTWSAALAAGPPQELLTAKPNRLLNETCARLEQRARAEGVRRRVYCPPLVPAARPLKIELAGGLRTYRQFAEGYQVGVWSPSPTVQRLGAHWSFAGGRPEAFEPFLHGTAPRFAPSATTHATIAGRRVTIYRMPKRASAFYAGHVVVQWRYGPNAYNVTAHGWKNERAVRRMAAALIRLMTSK
jgi:hypothetical protein